MFPQQNRRARSLSVMEQSARIMVVILSLLIFSCGASDVQDAGKQITAATASLEKMLLALNISGDEGAQRATEIREARSNIAAGYLYLSLYILQPCWVELTTRNYVAGKTEIEKKGQAAFEEEWRRLGVELDEKEKSLKQGAQGRRPAALLALAESSQIQVRPYYQSGHLYGLNTTIGNGLYFLGLAPANADFALFCQQLRFAQTKPPLKLRSLEAELAGLEADTLQSYRSPEASSRQPQYNRLNSNLKMAGELNRAAMYAGALHKYLESSLYLALINRLEVRPEELIRLNAQSEAFGRQLKSDNADHSIGLLYWEMAQSALNQAEAGQPDEHALKRAAVIIDRVIPAYLKYAMETKR